MPIGETLSPLDELVRAGQAIKAVEIPTGHIRRYVAERLNRGATNATINGELESLDRAFRLASACEPPKLDRLIHILTRHRRNQTGFSYDA